MNRPRVLVVPGHEFDLGAAELAGLAERHPSFDFTAGPADDPEVIIGWPAPAQLLGRCLRWVQIPSVGFDRYAAAGLPDGVVMTNGRGVFSAAIAEHALALLLALTRRLPVHVRRSIGREWRKSPGGAELAGARVLVAGTGAIGSAVARLLRAVGCTVVGVSRSGGPRPDFDRVLTAPLSPEDVHDIDAVVLALPRTSGTDGFWSAELSAAMRPGWYLVNVGRGSTLDEAGLLTALADGRLAGAGLDVTAVEPLPPDSPLWDDDRVILTAHSSGGTPRRAARFLELLDDNLDRYARGAPLRNPIDPAAGY